MTVHLSKDRSATTPSFENNRKWQFPYKINNSVYFLFVDCVFFLILLLETTKQVYIDAKKLKTNVIQIGRAIFEI